MRQTELTAQLCSIMRDVRNVRGNTQKKIEKLRQLLSGLLSELTYFEEVSPSFCSVCLPRLTHISLIVTSHSLKPLKFYKCATLNVFVAFICSRYGHHWFQVYLSLELCHQSHQYSKVHCIHCASLSEQQMAEVAKSCSKKGTTFDKTN